MLADMVATVESSDDAELGRLLAQVSLGHRPRHHRHQTVSGMPSRLLSAVLPVLSVDPARDSAFACLDLYQRVIDGPSRDWEWHVVSEIGRYSCTADGSRSRRPSATRRISASASA
jgi:hypothetical protein